MLTRTDAGAGKGAKGLSLFIVPKDPFPGHEFVMRHHVVDEADGARLLGRDRLGVEQHLERALAADQARQALGADEGGRHAEPDLRLA